MRSYSDPVKIPGSTRWYSRTRDPATGKRGYVALGSSILKDAKQRLATLRMEAAMGPERVKATRTADLRFDAAVVDWLGTKADKTRHATYRAQAEFWKAHFGSKLLRDIGPDDIRAYLVLRRGGRVTPPQIEGRKWKRRKPIRIGNVTANEERRSLATFFLWCVRNGTLDRSPVQGIERLKESPRERVTSLTEAEEAALLRACSEPYAVVVNAKRNAGGRAGGKATVETSEFGQTFSPPAYLRPVVVVAIKSGLRRRAILSLKWAHADLEAGTWRIPAALIKTGESYSAPMARSVVEALKTYRAARVVGDGPGAVKADAKVFPVKDLRSITGPFRRAAKRAGLTRLTFHDLRRCFLNSLVERGVPIDTTLSLTGHKSMAVVMAAYRKVSPERQRAALSVLDSPPANGGTTKEHA